MTKHFMKLLFSGARSSNPRTVAGEQLRHHGHRPQEVLQFHEPDSFGKFSSRLII